MGGAKVGLALLWGISWYIMAVGGMAEEDARIAHSEQREQQSGGQLLYPAGLGGYWQGTLETGALTNKGNSSGDDTPAVRQYKVQLVFSAGRRIAPPDTALPLLQRHAVVWETLTAELTGPNTGRFCEALSFNSRAQVGSGGTPGRRRTPGASYPAVLMQTPGVVCGIYNRTGDELAIAWATSEKKEAQFPLDFSPGSGTHVARLHLLTPEVFPAELEGQWGGVQLVTRGADGNSTMVQSEDPVNFTCSAGRCVFRGPVAPHSGRHEPAVVVTDTIFFQRAGESKGKFCEIVTFSSVAAVALTPNSSFGQLRHGAEVHCNVYKRVGRSLVIAWGADASGAAPTSFRPNDHTVVATLDLESERVAVPEIQGRWKGFVREKVGDGAVQATPALLCCSFGSCVLSEAADAQTGVRVFSVTSSRGTGLGTGQLCEVLVGGTTEQANSLQLREEEAEWEASQHYAIGGAEHNDTTTLESVNTTERLLRPSWDTLGQIRCAIFERRGSILKLATSIESTNKKTGPVPDGFQPRAGLVSSATFILQPPSSTSRWGVPELREGQVAMPSGAYGFNSDAGSISTAEVSPVNARAGSGGDVDYWTDSSSMSAYVAAAGDGSELPPTDLLLRNLRLVAQDAQGAAEEAKRPPTLKDWSASKSRSGDDTTKTRGADKMEEEQENEKSRLDSNVGSSVVAGTVLGKLHQQLGISPKAKLDTAAAATSQSSAGTRGAAPLRPVMLFILAILDLFWVLTTQ